jgi:membrane protein DedA with SNARE-associated domain
LEAAAEATAGAATSDDRLFVFQSLTNQITASGWAYPAIIGIAFLDAFFPLVPSETAVITGGVLAAQGDLSIELVLLCAAAGAIAGDNFTYLLGRLFGEKLSGTLFHGRRGKASLDWATRTLEAHGTVLILAARFIPGGRTATMFTCGLTDYPWRRFLVLTTIAGCGWALYAGLLGYFGGKTFEHDTWKALLLALGIAAAVTLTIEAVRRVRARHA